MSQRRQMLGGHCCFLGGILLLALAATADAEFDDLTPQGPNVLAFPAQNAAFVRVVILAASSGEPCFDEVEIYDEKEGRNVALASRGGKATASSCIAGYPIHQIAHLNDGHFGNAHSWIAAANENQWVQIALAKPTRINKVVLSRDREGRFADRMPTAVDIQVSLDGKQWQTVRRVAEDPLKAALLREREMWLQISADDHLSPLKTDRPALPDGAPIGVVWPRLKPTDRVLVQMEELCDRLAAKKIDVSAERQELARLHQRQKTLPPGDANAETTHYLDARMAKRRLMFRDPDLAPLTKLLFVKRYPYLSSHNYSDVMDSQFRSGGGICTLEIPPARGPPGAGGGKADDTLRCIRGDRPRSDDRFRRPKSLLRLPAGAHRGGGLPALLASDGHGSRRQRPQAIERWSLPRHVSLPTARRRPGLHFDPL